MCSIWQKHQVRKSCYYCYYCTKLLNLTQHKTSAKPELLFHHGNLERQSNTNCLVFPWKSSTSRNCIYIYFGKMIGFFHFPFFPHIWKKPISPPLLHLPEKKCSLALENNSLHLLTLKLLLKLPLRHCSGNTTWKKHCVNAQIPKYIYK